MSVDGVEDKDANETESDSYDDDDPLLDFIDAEDGDLARYDEIYTKILKCKSNKIGKCIS